MTESFIIKMSFDHIMIFMYNFFSANHFKPKKKLIVSFSVKHLVYGKRCLCLMMKKK